MLTSGNTVDLVSNEKEDQGNDGAVESARHPLSVLDRNWIWRAEGDAPKGPGNGRQEVRDHENVVPVMIVSRCNVGPASTGQSPENSPERNKARQLVPRLAR